MKLSVVLLLIGVLQVTASVTTSGQNISIKENNISLADLFWKIQEQTDFVFAFSSDDVKEYANLNINLEGELEDVLTEVLQDKNLKYELKNGVYVIKRSTLKQSISSQQPEEKKIIIKGTVVDEKGEPLPFAAVCFKGTTSGCVSAVDGTYELEAPDEEGLVLEVSSLGFVTQEIQVNGRKLIDIVLVPDVKGLDEVVVTGYQTISRERATGAFDKVSVRQLEKPSSNIAERLVGVAAGVQTLVDEDGNMRFEIRGQTSLGANSSPLVVVDGFPIEGDFNSINPNDVESVTVLKDAAAASIWGARSANGVIVVTTKKAKRGKVKVELNSFWKFENKLDLDYVNPLASSAETVAYEKHAFDTGFYGAPYRMPQYNLDGVGSGISQGAMILNAHRLGHITDAERDAQLGVLAAQNNRGQIEDNLLQVPVTQQYNLSVSGGNENMTNVLSVMFENKKDYYKNNDRDKFMVNFRNTLNVTKWLDFSFSGMIQYEGDDMSGANLGEIQALAPYDMLLDKDGKQTDLNNLYYYQDALYDLVPTDDFPYADWSYNPIHEINNRELKRKQINSRVQAGLNFKLMEGLNFDSKFMYEVFNVSNSNYYSEQSSAMRRVVNESTSFAVFDWNTYETVPGPIIPHMPKGGGLSRSSSEVTNYNFRNQLNFNRTFNEVHSFNFIAGTEIRDRSYEGAFEGDIIGYNKETNSTGRYIGDYNSDMGWLGWPMRYTVAPYSHPIGDIYYPLPTFISRTDRFFSMYSNLGYTYNDKYSLSASVRTDASNLITDDPKYRYAPFWSVGAGWQMHKEDFLSGTEWLNRLNLRATYGYNGNVDRSTSFKPLISLSGANDLYTNRPDASIASHGNPTLRWEKTRTLDLGLDFVIFSGKLRGTIDYYDKLSSDLIIEETIPSVHGTNTAKFNNGAMSNKGIEVSLGTTLPIARELIWNGNVNFAYNKNEITELSKDYYSYFYDLRNSGSRNADERTMAYMQGESANTLWSLVYAGLENRGTEENPMYLPVYQGANGQTHLINNTQFPGEDAREFMSNEGVLVAPYIMGFTNSFQYKNLELSFIITGKFGHVYRRHSFNYPFPGTGNTAVNNKYSEVVNGDPMEIVPIPDNESGYFRYDYFYTPYMSYLTADASHIRFQELSLSYSLPKQLVSKIGLERVQFYGQVNNLGTIVFNDYDEDPEYPMGSFKPQAMYTFGFNLTL